jgi:hypothetical protein
MWVYVMGFGLTAIALISMVVAARKMRVDHARASEAAERMVLQLEAEERARTLKEQAEADQWNEDDRE